MDRKRQWIGGVAVVLGALVFTTGPLYRVRTWWPHTDPLSADVAVVVVQVLFGALAIAALASGNRWRRVDPMIASVGICLVAWMALGAAWSASPSTTLRESLLVGVALLVGAAAAASVEERILLVAAWIGVHIGLGWSAVLIVLVQPGSQDANGEWTGVYFNPNSLALIAAFGIFLALVTAFAAARWPHRYLAFVVLGASVLADFWLISGTGALTSLFGLAAGLVVGVVALIVQRAIRRRPNTEARYLVAGAGAALVAVGAVAWWQRNAWLPSVGRTGDLTGRTAMWEVAIEWSGRQPIVGQGYLGAWFDAGFAAQMLAERGEVLGSSHNSFIEILLGAGLIGFVLIVGLFALLWLRAGVRALEGRGPLAVWPIALVMFLIIENVAETLWVAGQLSVVLVGVLAVVSAPPKPVVEPAPSNDQVAVDVEARS